MRDRRGHLGRVDHLGQRDEPGPVGEGRCGPRGSLDRQPRLADAAGSDERDQAGVPEEIGDRRELVLAPDERGQGIGQRAGHGRGRPEQWEVGLESPSTSTWTKSSGRGTSRSRWLPRSRSAVPAGRRSAMSAAVGPDTRIWPP